MIDKESGSVFWRVSVANIYTLILHRPVATPVYHGPNIWNVREVTITSIDFATTTDISVNEICNKSMTFVCMKKKKFPVNTQIITCESFYSWFSPRKKRRSYNVNDRNI